MCCIDYNRKSSEKYIVNLYQYRLIYNLARECRNDSIERDRDINKQVFVENVAAINVKQTVSLIRQKSTILNNMIAKGEIGICGAMYDVETGNVEFYGDTVAIN